MQDQGTPFRFLGKIQLQVSKLTEVQLKNFLILLLKELITIVDVLLSEAQKCFQSLLIIYITQTVGKESKRPSDWAHSEEVMAKHFKKCNCCAKMNNFLMNSKTQTHRIFCKHFWDWKYKYLIISRLKRSVLLLLLL